MTNSGAHAIEVSSRLLNIVYSFMIYLTILSVAQNLHHNMIGFSLNSDVEMMLKETSIVLVESIGFWRWCITLRITGFFVFFPRLIF
jgi:hypothetical protein